MHTGVLLRMGCNFGHCVQRQALENYVLGDFFHDGHVHSGRWIVDGKRRVHQTLTYEFCRAGICEIPPTVSMNRSIPSIDRCELP